MSIQITIFHVASWKDKCLTTGDIVCLTPRNLRNFLRETKIHFLAIYCHNLIVHHEIYVKHNILMHYTNLFQSNHSKKLHWKNQKILIFESKLNTVFTTNTSSTSIQFGIRAKYCFYQKKNLICDRSVIFILLDRKIRLSHIWCRLTSGTPPLHINWK